MDTLIVFSNNDEKHISVDDYIYQVYKGKKLYSYTYSYLERALLHKSRRMETDFNYEKHVKLNLDNLYVVRSKKDIIPSAFINGTIDIQALQKELKKPVNGIVLFDIKNPIKGYLPIIILSIKSVQSIKIVSKRISSSNKRERQWIAQESCAIDSSFDCMDKSSCIWNVDAIKSAQYKDQMELLEATSPNQYNTIDDTLETLIYKLKTYSKEKSALEDKTYDCKEYRPLRNLSLVSLSKIMKPYKYYAFANHEFNFKNMKQSTNYKPNGFWFASGDEWLKYITKEKFRIHDYNYLYEVEIYKNQVLEISTLQELREFASKYKEEQPTYGYNLPIDDVQVKHLIDWNKVSQETGKSGIIINTNFKQLYNTYDKRHQIEQYFKDIEWYITWDVASGSIWRKNGIKKMTLIYKREEGRVIPYREKKNKDKTVQPE